MKLEFLVRPLLRRHPWLLEQLTLRKLWNVGAGLADYARGNEWMHSLPMALKSDITPLCNLHCTICLHARPDGNPALARQRFHGGQRMTVEQFARIVEEVKGRTSAVSLFYLGDPLMHPDVDALCGLGRRAGLNVHLTSHLSYRFDAERLHRLVTSGVTHLTVCVDGLSQQSYQRTRVGGRIDWVLANLRELCKIRGELGRVYPRIEVQYLKYRHNLGELQPARRRFREMGVDRVVTAWGALHNYSDQEPGTYTLGAPRSRTFAPRCLWPYLTMVIKYDGDAIPCCLHRYASQYTADGTSRALGNVFASGVREVWNNAAYRATRRFVTDPRRAEREPVLASQFCYACPSLFATGVEANLRFGDRYVYEDLYDIGEDGRPVRCTHGPGRRGRVATAHKEAPGSQGGEPRG